MKWLNPDNYLNSRSASLGGLIGAKFWSGFRGEVEGKTQDLGVGQQEGLSSTSPGQERLEQTLNQYADLPVAKLLDKIINEVKARRAFGRYDPGSN